MSQGIASKNLYELLGNDPELDPERATPQPPTKAVDKPVPRSGKRNGPAEPPLRDSPIHTGRRGQPPTANANENAFRDPTVGAGKNRERGSGEPGPTGERARGELGRGRGTRRGAGRGRTGMAGDRHSRTGIADNEKQAAHGWGAQDGGAEWADEKAGEAIAKADEKDAAAEPTAEEIAAAEEEEKTKSYDAYLAELAEKKLQVAAPNAPRKPNEGSTQKFPEGKPITRDEEDAYIAGTSGKKQRERERKTKEFVELDDAKLHREAPRESTRGRGRGRGDFRGEGRGRGEFRGGRGRGEGRGRGGEGRGRGGRGGQATVNVADPSAFPSLGS